MIHLIVILLVIGVILYFLNTLPAIDSKIKTLINVVVVIGALLLVLDFFGVLDGYDYRPHRAYRP